jgi:hypothetical protein
MAGKTPFENHREKYGKIREKTRRMGKIIGKFGTVGEISP